jgi:hypothetical protein
MSGERPSIQDRLDWPVISGIIVAMLLAVGCDIWQHWFALRG